MTEEEFYERTANWLRGEMGFLVDSLTDIDAHPEIGVVDIHFTFTDEDGLSNDAYEYEGYISDLEEEVAAYED